MARPIMRAMLTCAAGLCCTGAFGLLVMQEHPPGTTMLWSCGGRGLRAVGWAVVGGRWLSSAVVGRRQMLQQRQRVQIQAVHLGQQRRCP